MNIDWNQGFVPSVQTSAAIRMVRPLLIILMSFAHFSLIDHMSRVNSAASLDLDNWLMVFLKGSLAKSGVPLLSLISGYLAVLSLDKYGYLQVLIRKARRLVWPLIWANLIFIVLITWPAQAQDPGVRPDLQIHPFNAYGWFQATFAFYKIPANEPLYFLKDLYTCFLLLPLLALVARVRYLNVAIIFWMAYKCIYLKSAFFFEIYPLWFMRFDIVFAFYIGILLFHWKRNLVIRSPKLNAGLIALFLASGSLVSVVYVVLAKPEHIELFLWLDFLVKLCSVLGCIAIMSLLAMNPGRVARFLEWLSPYAYTLFLTHLLVFTFFTRAWRSLAGEPDFFGFSGVAYILVMLFTAVTAAIVLKKGWGGMITRVRDQA
ncbi:acyltransferase family protein [Pseudomonadota bacterium]